MIRVEDEQIWVSNLKPRSFYVFHYALAQRNYRNLLDGPGSRPFNSYGIQNRQGYVLTEGSHEGHDCDYWRSKTLDVNYRVRFFGFHMSLFGQSIESRDMS